MLLLPILFVYTSISRPGCMPKRGWHLLFFGSPGPPLLLKLLLPRCSPPFPHTRSKSKTGSPLHIGGSRLRYWLSPSLTYERPFLAAGFLASTLSFDVSVGFGCLLPRSTLASFGTKVSEAFVLVFTYCA